MTVRITCCFVVIMTSLYATSARGESYLDLSLGGGRADQTYESDDPSGERNYFRTLDLDAVTVWRVALGGGIRFSSGFEVGSELSWSQRGATSEFLVRNVFHQWTETIEYKRSYLDVSMPVLQNWQLGTISIAIGGAPRISRFLEEDRQSDLLGEPENWVFGIDPEIRLTYAVGYAWARYYLDVTPSHETTVSEMRDRTFFFGMGLRVQ